MAKIGMRIAQSPSLRSGHYANGPMRILCLKFKIYGLKFLQFWSFFGILNLVT